MSSVLFEVIRKKCKHSGPFRCFKTFDVGLSIGKIEMSLKCHSKGRMALSLSSKEGLCKVGGVNILLSKFLEWKNPHYEWVWYIQIRAHSRFHFRLWCKFSMSYAVKYQWLKPRILYSFNTIEKKEKIMWAHLWFFFHIIYKKFTWNVLL